MDGGGYKERDSPGDEEKDDIAGRGPSLKSRDVGDFCWREEWRTPAPRLIL